jgi:hypothetical protein
MNPTDGGQGGPGPGAMPGMGGPDPGSMPGGMGAQMPMPPQMQGGPMGGPMPPQGAMMPPGGFMPPMGGMMMPPGGSQAPQGFNPAAGFGGDGIMHALLSALMQPVHNVEQNFGTPRSALGTIGRMLGSAGQGMGGRSAQAAQEDQDKMYAAFGKMFLASLRGQQPGQNMTNAGQNMTAPSSGTSPNDTSQ